MAEMPPRDPADRRPPSYDQDKEGYTGISAGALDTVEGIEDARAFAEMIVDTVREGLLVLDLDLRVVAANESFYRTFGVDPEETVSRPVYDLGNGQWDIPELRELLERVLPHEKTFDDYEVDHAFEDVGRRVMVLNARRLDDHRLVLLAIEDVTERRGAETALHEREAREGFLLRLGDALRPLADPAEVQAEAMRLLGEHLGLTRAQYYEADADGEHLVSRGGYAEGAPLVLERVRIGDFGDFLNRAFRGGETLVADDGPADPRLSEDERAAYAALGIRAWVAVPLVKDGRLVALLGVHAAPRAWAPGEVALVEETAERTWAAVERARAEGARRESEDRYRTLFESIDEGFCIIEVLFDDDGAPEDYRFVEVNPAFEAQTGLRDPVGHRVRALVPGHEAHWFETYGRIARTGRPERFTNEARALGRWYDVYAFRVGDPEERRVAVLFNDVTAQRRAEAEVRELNRTLEARIEARTAQVRALSRALTMAEQEERRRLAEVLHDDLQQVLHGALIQVEVGRPDRVEALLQDAVRTARSLSHELAPPILRGQTVGELFEWLAERERALYGLEVEHAGGHLEVAEEEVRVLLYRLLRELLFNVSKHAGTDRARVRAEPCGDRVRVVVEDEGAGFDPEAVRAGAGLGLASVRERLEAVGGRMEVASSPGEGTRVVIEVPAGAGGA